MKHPALRATGPRRDRTAGVALLLLLPPLLAFGTCAGGLAATVGDPVTLRWGLEPGRVLHYVMVQESSHVWRPDGGRAARVERRQQVDFRWIVVKVDDSIADMTLIVDRIRLRLDCEGSPPAFEFDTASDPARKQGPFAERLAALLHGLAGAKIDFRMDARGEILDVKIPEPARSLIHQAGQTAAAAAISEEGVRNLIVQAHPLLPEGPVEPGATWSRQATAAMPMLGALVLDKTYTYRGPQADRPARHEVVVDTRITLRPTPEALMEAKILKQSGSGRFSFDADRGVVASYHLEDDLTMAFSAQGQRIEQVIASRIEVTLVPPADASHPPSSPR